MEGLVDLLPLLFIGLYYLLASRRKAKVREAQQQRVEAPQTELVQDEPRASSPFQDFLGQLEEAMQEASGAGPPEPEPVPAPVVELPEEPTGRPLATATPEFRATSGSFDSARPVDHEAHGFGRENPLSEERFEQAPAFVALPSSPDRAFDPHGLHGRRPPATGTRGWRRRLRDPEAARDAFVLQTIFGPRGGIRGDRPKR